MTKKLILIIVVVLAIFLVFQKSHKIYIGSVPNDQLLASTSDIDLKSDDVVVTEVKNDLNEDAILQDKIDQLFIVGFRGITYDSAPDLKKIIEQTNVGGIILFDYDSTRKTYNRNIQSFSQIKKLIKDTQSKAKTKLFVSIDEEGGLVSRLKTVKGYTKTPQAFTLGEMIDEKVFAVGQKLGTTLKDLGFNMDFAPVLDTNVDPKSPAIGAVGRSFSSDPDVVASKAIAFSKGLMSSGIISVGKHYPGHGSATTDTHLGFADVTDTYKDYESAPFAKACDSGMKAIMVAHLYNKNIDTTYPATLSSKHINNLENIGCDNVLVISDDMDMKAITKQYTRKDALVRAINAGVDVLIISNNISTYDSSEFFTARKIIFDAVRNGDITETRINEAYNKVIELKTSKSLI